jgi:hypothetical protein
VTAKKKPAAPAKKAAKPVLSKTPAAKQAAPATKHRTDWEAVERDYRAGKLTLREMADKHGCTNGRICQVAKEKGWTRGDLKKAVSEATQALLIEQHVSNEVSRVKQGLSETVLAAAEVNKQVVMRHRGDLSKARDVALRMLEQLDLTTTKADEIEDLFGKITEDMSGPALAAAQSQFRDFMRLGARVGSMHKLADTLKKLQEQERTAFGLDDAGRKVDDDIDTLSDDELNSRIEQHLERRSRQA